MEGLLKIKGAFFIPGTPFLYKTSPLGSILQPKSGPRNYKKRTKNAMRNFTEKVPKKIPKRFQNDSPNPPWEPQNDAKASDYH